MDSGVEKIKSLCYSTSVTIVNENITSENKNTSIMISNTGLYKKSPCFITIPEYIETQAQTVNSIKIIDVIISVLLLVTSRLFDTDITSISWQSSLLHEGSLYGPSGLTCSRHTGEASSIVPLTSGIPCIRATIV